MTIQNINCYYNEFITSPIIILMAYGELFYKWRTELYRAIQYGKSALSKLGKLLTGHTQKVFCPEK